MLSLGEINETEIIFLAIDTGLLSDEICEAIMLQILQTNKEAHIYLMWLLTRWRGLRRDKSDLPTILKHRIAINELINK
jgi:hypothetical protein